MKFSKPALDYGAQADLLLARGMDGDRELMIYRLAMVNYYRLSAYWHPFREDASDQFKSGTTFDSVWGRYVFDRRLRLMVMDAIERIEVAVRSWLAYRHSHRGAKDPFGYATDGLALPYLRPDEKARFLSDVQDLVGSSKETFVEHFRGKYGDEHSCMPVWMVCEIMSFGHLVTMFRGSPNQLKTDVASHLDVHHAVLLSWLLTLNSVRNLCAHHGRLWNRELGVSPKVPVEKNDADWHSPVAVGGKRFFVVATILRYCLVRIAPQSQWPSRLRDLLAEGTVPLKSMGFPDDWELCPIWK